MGSRLLRNILILLAATVVGFLFGRYILGEGYLGPTLKAIEPQTPLPRPITPGPNSQANYPVVPPPPEEPSANPPVAETPPAENAGEGNLPEVVENAPTVRYAVQVGSFGDLEKANQLSQDITRQGYAARVESREIGGEVVHRVLVGSYTSEDSARLMAEELKNAGQQAFVVQP
jgi:cell division protein FtsN